MIEVICGPMFSGKSNEIILRYMREKIKEKNPILIKHSLDTRFSIDEVTSRAGLQVKCYLAKDYMTLKEILLQNKTNFVIIDEVQFFSDDDIIPILKEFSKKDFLLCGLDMDWTGAPFGCMPKILAMADEVVKLKAVCTEDIDGSVCGAPASKTKKLDLSNNNIIQIGNTEYAARCNYCWGK